MTTALLISCSVVLGFCLGWLIQRRHTVQYLIWGSKWRGYALHLEQQRSEEIATVVVVREGMEKVPSLNVYDQSDWRGGCKAK